MERKGVSQEGLKLIACITMLIDHIGATMVPGAGLRIIGRIAFPIFCFLLVEGAHYTRNPGKYALRLFIGMLLSEIPFDLAFSGRADWSSQSVMVTLFLGYGAIFILQALLRFLAGKGFGNVQLAICFAIAAAVLFTAAISAADYLQTDYGAGGIMLIASFYLARVLENSRQDGKGKLPALIWQLACMAFLCGLVIPGYRLRIGPFRVPIELFAILALIPIHLYQGRKVTRSKAIQWAFYLFYPAHLLILYLIRVYT